ncbi:pyridoxamine phosphate oxidase family protein [Sclerotinia borealis F-4128]|uniref:Pyridoxamine phosphate oxidase family protein n=1 Tax=Sclerotinia borealis (strain F-4128) TaxID=1432307 RepID=W9CE87_SCLBF|nr:pyridoxamine phosphate oxidase family protein [Sclerotinia borealis F-4128]
MVQYFDSISKELADWAMAQPLFFVASAPTYGKHVNVSPKGLPGAMFRILGGKRCAYIDATGSGVETISHIYENGRITIMFCSFTSTPRIMRFFCTGKVVEWNTPSFASTLLELGMENVEGARAVILLDVWKVQTSCGYGVPLLTPLPTQISHQTANPSPSLGPWTDRKTLGHWAGQKVAKDEMQDYQVQNNSYSHDALPGLRSARERRFGGYGYGVGYGAAVKVLVKGDEVWRWWMRVVREEWRGVVLGVVLGLLVGAVVGGTEGVLGEFVVGRVLEVRELMGNLTGAKRLEVEL